MKLQMIVSALAIASLSADLDHTDIISPLMAHAQIIQYHVDHIDEGIIILKNRDALTLDDDALVDFYQIAVPHVHEYTFLTKKPFDYFEVYAIDQDNFIIEAASNHRKELFYIGHLPSLTLDQMNYLKSGIETSCPYVSKIISGDFHYKYLDFSNFDLCVKREVELSAESDSKGNKSAKGELTIKSDDSKNKASIEYEYKQNDRGEKESRAKASIKTEF